MFLIRILFLLSTNFGLKLYPNLGIVLNPRDNLVTFNSFGHVRGSLIINLANIDSMKNVFNDECLNKQGITPEQREILEQTKSIDLGTIFHREVAAKLINFSEQYIRETFITRNDTEIQGQVKSREERQIIEFISGVVGYLGGELIHKLFGTSTEHQIRELKTNIRHITQLRNVQINDLYTKIGDLDCQTNAKIFIEHQNMLKLMVRRELEKLDEILFSIHYRVGFQESVHKMMRQACMLATNDFDLCEDLITNKFFSLEVKDVYTSGDNQIEFELEFLFPTGVEKQVAFDLHNYGFISENSDGLIGKRISNLDDLDVVIEPLGLGISKNKCTKLSHFYLCSQEVIRPNYFSQNLCLQDIKMNKTEMCEISEFPIKRPCLVHKIGQTPLISAAVPYKLLRNIRNSEGKVTIKTTTGIPGLYPLTKSEINDVESITLLCKNTTKYLTIAPLVMNEPIIINSVPSVNPIVDPNIFNMTTFMRDELRINELINNILDTKFVKNISHKDIIYTSIITILVLVSIIFCVSSHKLRNYCKKVRDIELV